MLEKAIHDDSDYDKLVTIGIKPTFSSTGYGYINFEEKVDGILYKVNEFVEKPSFEVAKFYVESGDFGWNDVGSWDSLGSIYPSDDMGNIVKGSHVNVDTRKV